MNIAQFSVELQHFHVTSLGAPSGTRILILQAKLSDLPKASHLINGTAGTHLS